MTPAPALPAADVCAVCLAIPEQRGRLDSCCHLFCVPCIVRWASIETKCPLCKERFTKMTPEDASTSACAGPVMEFRETNQGDERPDEAEEESEDEAERYFCDVCRRGDDEASLLLCDACDIGAHTFCVGLESVPRGRWFCELCRGMEGEFAGARDGGSSRRRRRAEAESRARDILLRSDGGVEAVRTRERRADRARRAVRARQRGEIRRRGGGGERSVMRSRSGGCDDARVEQISRVHVLREAWEMLQSGEVEFPGWTRIQNTPSSPRSSVPSAPRRVGSNTDEDGPKDVVDEAWDVLEKAMHADDKKKKRASTSDKASTAVASTSAPKLKRPSIRSEPPGWSMSATAWKPREETARATPVPQRAAPSNSDTSRPLPAASSPDKSLKFAIADRVKAVLRPLYAAGDVTKDEYRRICKCATSEALASNATDDASIAHIVHRLRKR